MAAATEHDEQTFLFADLAGFTALTEVHGDEAAADAVADFCAGVRRLLDEFGAEEVKSIGDAEMVRVPDARLAIELAIRIVRDVGAEHGSLAVRIGAHTGPAVRRGDDWFGAAVNLAARVAAAAHRGEILLTAATKAAGAPALEPYAIESRGARQFRNVAEPVELFALTLSAQPDVADLPIDPVCRMAVEPARSPADRTYAGTTFYFCSTGCAEVFDHGPQRYVGTAGSQRP